MNILVLNASPRPGGTVSQMLDALAGEAAARGHAVTRVRVQSLRVHPCTGCMTCRTARRCVLPDDDAQRVLGLLEACDVLVVGAPCYWGNMPGTLKLLFDRMVYGLMGESPRGLPRPLHRGKRAVVLTACTTPWPFNRWFRQSAGTEKALREILKWSGFRIVQSIQRGGTKNRPLTPKDLERCRRAARRL